MPEVQFNQFPALFIRRNSPAAEALMRALNAESPAHNSIFFVSDEELASLKVDAVALEV